MPLLSSVAFASLLQYAVRGTSPLSLESQQVRKAIKAGKAGHLVQLARVIGEHVHVGDEFGAYFGTDVFVVPAPGHALRSPGTLSVPAEICRYLSEAGLVGGVLPALERVVPVLKSAFGARGARRDPARHFETIQLVGLPLANARRLLVVDDVVTTGATLLACASLLQDAYPLEQVRAFAAIRAVSDGEITSIRHPCTGTITLDTLSGTTTRRP